MGGKLRILSVHRIPIYLHTSWILVYALITWTLAVGYFPRVLPNGGTGTYWVSGLVAALLLFASVLLHELSHSFVASARGLRVRGITLHVFGGVSELEDEPRTPSGEFLMAAAGPLMSFAIAAVLWVIGALGLVPTGAPAAIVGYLVFVNAAVGVFNLLPGFPLDGGRLLRAAIWRWKGDLQRATVIATRVGAGVAFALIGLGIVQILGGALVGGFWTILIGLFLRSAADASYTQTALRGALSGIPVEEVMARPVVTVPADTTLDAVAQQLWVHHFTSFPVVTDGAVRGIVTMRHLREVAYERWPATTVQKVMAPLTDSMVVRPADDCFAALGKASQNGIGRLVVMDGARLVGYLSLTDVTRVLARHGFETDGLGSRRRAA